MSELQQAEEHANKPQKADDGSLYFDVPNAILLLISLY